MDANVARAERGECTDGSRSDQCSWLKNLSTFRCIFTRTSDERAGLHRARGNLQQCKAVRDADIFMSHHGVCTDWNRRTSHDADGVTSAHGNWRLADAGLAIRASRDRKTVSRGHRGEVCNAHRKPVH